MKNLKVYCAHPISGLTWDEVVNYYNDIKEKLEAMGLSVFQPMTGKSEIRTEIGDRFQPEDFKSAVASNHAIFERDQCLYCTMNINPGLTTRRLRLHSCRKFIQLAFFFACN